MKKNKVHLTEAECRLVVVALNKLRTSLIREGRCTDTIDEALYKVINAPVRKVRAG